MTSRSQPERINDLDIPTVSSGFVGGREKTFVRMITSYSAVEKRFYKSQKKVKKTTRPTIKRKSYENIIPVRSGHRGRIYHEDEAFIISYVFLRTNCREALVRLGRRETP